MIKRTRLASAALLALCALTWWGANLAWSRDWKPTQATLARNYLLISDTRDVHDIRMIFWIAPPIVSEPSAQQVLKDYVVLGVVRARGSATGTMSFDPIDTLEAKDGEGKPLQLLRGDDIPPAINGVVTVLEGVFGQSFGAFGKGFHWFVFAAGAVNACKDGGLSVPFADEDYSYPTPIPGCQASSG